MAYERVNWENLPSTKTPVNADNLNKMDEGIANAVEKTAIVNNRSTSTEEIYSANYMNAKIYNGDEVIQLNSGYTLLSSYIFKLSNVYFVNVVIKKDSGYWTNMQENIGSLLNFVGNPLNSGCFISRDEWATQFAAYMYVSNINIFIRDQENKNCNIAKLKFSFVSKD